MSPLASSANHRFSRRRDSIGALTRETGLAKSTVTKLLVDLGAACAEHPDRPEHRGTFGHGDVWTWTAIDAKTKPVPSLLVGGAHV